MKKRLFFVLVSLLVLFQAACKTKIKGEIMEELEGEEGVFADIVTEKGDILLRLFYKECPLTVVNFVGLAEGKLKASRGKPFYNGLKFHRVIENFMIQGGDPLGNGTGGPGYSFPDEISSRSFDKAGLLAMANAGANTNGSQFFITHVETAWLNGKHTIFGETVNERSQEVVNAIKRGDKIISVNIIRQGKEAQSFKASQEDFDSLFSKANEVFENQKKAFEKAQEDSLKKFTKSFNKSGDILYKIISEGRGEKIRDRKRVQVHYKGYLLNGNVFDTSWGREPLEFVTANGQMILGFDEMVQDMKLSEKRTIVLPPHLAYGSQGVPNVIPGNAYIVFDVEIVGVK